MSCEGRTAVVTGAARGIGRAIAEELASASARVVCVDLADSAETVSHILEAGGEVLALRADVSSEADVQALAGQIHDSFGPVDILVNNAALMAPPTPFLEIDFAFWRRVLSVNVDSQFLMAQALLPDMIERGWGRIVNVGSSSILTATAGIAHYMASKGAVIGLTSGLANDVGRFGVTVNAVSPGVTRTAGVEELLSSAGVVAASVVESAIAAQAIKREGVPDDVVGLVRFLVGESASFMTGQFLVVDGGLTRR